MINSISCRRQKSGGFDKLMPAGGAGDADFTAAFGNPHLPLALGAAKIAMGFILVTVTGVLKGLFHLVENPHKPCILAVSSGIVAGEHAKKRKHHKNSGNITEYRQPCNLRGDGQHQINHHQGNIKAVVAVPALHKIPNPHHKAIH